MALWVVKDLSLENGSHAMYMSSHFTIMLQFYRQWTKHKRYINHTNSFDSNKEQRQIHSNLVADG